MAAATRQLLSLVYYGLREAQIRCLQASKPVSTVTLATSPAHDSYTGDVCGRHTVRRLGVR